MKSKVEKEEKIKLITFGSEKVKSLKSWSTKQDLRSKNGKYFSCVANIVPVICGNAQRET